MRKLKLGVAAVALALAIVPTAAVAGQTDRPAQGPVVLSGAGGQFYGYVTPVMVVQQGGELSYANFDIVQHDVVHYVEADEIFNKKKDPWCKMYKKGTCPLFWSARASVGEVVDVFGLQNLESGGVFTFFCTLHPGMKGSLVVL